MHYGIISCVVKGVGRGGGGSFVIYTENFFAHCYAKFSKLSLNNKNIFYMIEKKTDIISKQGNPQEFRKLYPEYLFCIFFIEMKLFCIFATLFFP